MTTTTTKPSLPKRGDAPFRPAVNDALLDEIGSKAVKHAAAAVQPAAPVEVKLPKLTVNFEPDMLKRFKLRCVNDGVTGQALLHKLISDYIG